MGNDRNKSRKGDSGRDPGGFVAMPWTVLDSAAYKRQSYPSRALLMEIARQFVRDNNGRLLASRAYLAKRDWTSASVIDRAKRELIEAGLIFETVKGHRPNKASWYAVTWRALDRHPNYDAGKVAAFERGAYRTLPLAPAKPSREETFDRWRKTPLKNAALSPSHGTEQAAIGPPAGTEKASPVPSPGPIKPLLACVPVPSPGHHLDMPSPDAQREAEQANDAVNLSDFVRVREADLDPALFDAVTGEHVRAKPKPPRATRAAAEEWLAKTFK